MDKAKRINDLLAANNVLVERVRAARKALNDLNDWSLSGDDIAEIINRGLKESNPR